MSNVASVGHDTVVALDRSAARRAGRAVIANLLEAHGGDSDAMREEAAKLIDMLGLNGRPIRTNYVIDAISHPSRAKRKEVTK